MEAINKKVIGSLWRMDDVVWNFLPAKGSAGGILIMWRKYHVNCHDVISGETTLSRLFSNLPNGEYCYFSEVYCGGNNEECNLLGNEISNIKELLG